MRNYVVTHQDTLADFNEGSGIRSLLEAPAREIASLYNKCIANLELYARLMAYAQFGFERKLGIAASGSVIFSRNAISALSITIPAGVSVSTSDGIEFITLSEGVIPPGSSDSNAVVASCPQIGAVGNVGAAQINTIDYSVYGVDRVRNDSPFSGGVDAETDEAYRARFSEFIVGLGRSSVAGVRAAALSVNGVVSVSLVEHFPAENGYHFTLYAENGSGSLPAAIKNELTALIIGNDATDGARACGVNGRILAPEIVKTDVHIVFKTSGAIPPGIIEKQIIKNVANYINELKIGELYDKKVVYNLVTRQTGVFEVTTITPATIEISKRQIIRLGTLVVEGT
jgi:uncharacterized phage protein gp47/JayE